MMVMMVRGDDGDGDGDDDEDDNNEKPCQWNHSMQGQVHWCRGAHRPHATAAPWRQGETSNTLYLSLYLYLSLTLHLYDMERFLHQTY